MSPFSEYEKMPKSFQLSEEGSTVYSRLKRGKWVATEKIHGANFSFVYEHKILKFAKRKEYLSWKDDFFGFQMVVQKIENKVLALMEELSRTYKGDKIILYGELFGGSYPHPQVLPTKEVQAIQTGVYYSPDIQFCAFDIAIESDSGKVFLDFEEALEYFKSFDLLHASPLIIGSLTDVMDFNTRISSTLPARFKLPELPGNLIEGIVIKPLRHREYIGTLERPIFKIKNKEFDEEKKFHQAEKWSFIPDARSRSEDLAYILTEIRNYLNRNRLNSAISKIGAPDSANQPRMDAIIKECEEDTLLDFNANNPGILSELSAEDMEWIRERVRSEIILLLSS